MPAVVFKCQCTKCANHPNGFEYQTRNLITKHQKVYGLEKTTALPPQRAVLLNTMSQNQPHEPQVEPHAGSRDNPFDENSCPGFHLEDSNDDFLPPFHLESRHVSPIQPPDRPHAPPQAHHQAQAPDNAFQPVELPAVREAGIDVDQEDKPSFVPPAFAEESCVHMAYLQVVVGKIYNHLTIQQATDNLNGTLDTLLAAGVLPVYPRPVRTLKSAKRKLGIDADQWITQYAICLKCWKHHAPKEMDELPSALCTVPNCDGIIFDEYQDGKGHKKRKPHKINPQTSPCPPINFDVSMATAILRYLRSSFLFRIPLVIS